MSAPDTTPELMSKEQFFDEIYHAFWDYNDTRDMGGCVASLAAARMAFDKALAAARAEGYEKGWNEAWDLALEESSRMVTLRIEANVRHYPDGDVVRVLQQANEAIRKLKRPTTESRDAATKEGG